ncbi:hypothetical protein MLD63_12870 [Paracoccus sp. TK19116]|uniref:Uncharacterized protein n=1 Tax=Paracoccus albicereus TaxID=2922394 RepID=A0ABT1MV20_9RHOB|nr:hypothetical protein [Paracoccus albicereus]MCQ0971316.1 hypothetical protein [Paracoccus albicereus]
MIRPGVQRLARDWAEVGAAIVIGLFSLWMTFWGGWFFAALGLFGVGVSLVWTLGAIRRRRFHHDIAAPGMVEIDEGAVRYYGAQLLGGQLALRDLTEIRLLRLNGHLHWRLKSDDGQALLVPLEAAGAESLAHGFAALPGMDMGAISNALRRGAGPDAPSATTVWSRRDRGLT